MLHSSVFIHEAVGMGWSAGGRGICEISFEQELLIKIPRWCFDISSVIFVGFQPSEKHTNIVRLPSVFLLPHSTLIFWNAIHEKILRFEEEEILLSSDCVIAHHVSHCREHLLALTASLYLPRKKSFCLVRWSMISWREMFVSFVT